MILAKITNHFQQKVVACICEKSFVQQRERFAFSNLLVILKYVSNNYMPACIMLAVSLNSLIWQLTAKVIESNISSNQFFNFCAYKSEPWNRHTFEVWTIEIDEI